MSRFRLIASIVLMYVMLLMEYPMPTIVTSLVIIVAYFIIKSLPSANSPAFSINYEARNSRLVALETAAMFLAPYKDIWRDLRLSNKFCSVSLAHDGSRITVKEKINDYTKIQKSFRIISSKRYSNAKLWDIICLNFDYSTTYHELKEKCQILYEASISENVQEDNSTYKANAVNAYSKTAETLRPTNKNATKVDVNNASEIELTALPGISIVMSKRIIKKREEIRGFKNLNEFFLFIKVKPHMEEQLRGLVCVEKMKGSLKIERFKERKLDL